ncbi:MAG: hypothetical protein IRY95_09325, partial [Clostridia bacterium]|nr:hypothetical protein [Clostridia bacterium]
MRVSYKWLREWVATPLGPEELAEALTLQGVNVDGVERPSPVDGVVVGRVLEVAPHPAAHHLRVCRVETGRG